ncbi:MAG TPA: 2-oxoacid:acceptor oxidoreductase family protein [Candidatus Hydrogenedentes bacterium]|nr:2-oxoacid:acceptor oxidoreductase family protein [Candidatus Hydrogenedentota bacterium]HOT50167.1 2-oxoacid:acceptor oxidoreductase family protein [Candidatus Hydrogenedentota bacterium]HOV74943.1 2-oxoacid:acceptor oxidoreductase family protein [Candidatus Hydrogenedentota bacterium]HPC16713.1 2-oxoacid:acceptor oxidoreductase family protein [Candidatus Hydrogenedentota bacterium]HRT21914.1 2-oxoacid:acceptor oxidoreductase family protein [Candidatus Hydrogenedentota bacterium]
MSAATFQQLQVPAARYEIRLSGSGGQGMMLAAMLLCEAIGNDSSLNVVQTKSYGPEARGGASKADIVVSPTEIYYPKPFRLDLLLAMTQEALDKYYPDLREQGTLILDETLVADPPDCLYFGLPLTQLAREEVQNVMVANVISLGAIAAITDIVPREALMQAVLARAPKGTEEKNKLALEVGFREGAALRQQERYRNAPMPPAWFRRERMALCGKAG